jgi:O-antigen/teichoic acid export membrane protein
MGDKAGNSSLFGSASALLAAKIVFVIAGYAIYVGLSRMLVPAHFGIFLVVNSAVGVINAVFVSGSIQAVSRFVSQTPALAGGTLKTAFGLHLVLAGGLSALFFLAAPLLARLLNDPGLAPYLRVAAVIPLAYAFYAAMIGFANGLRRFHVQAGFDMAFSLIKVTLVVGLPWLGYGAFGAVAGFSIAAVTILVAAWLVIGRRSQEHGTPSSTTAMGMLRFEAAVMGHVGLTNLLMQLDLLMVQSLAPGTSAGLASALYGSAAKLAQIPYSVLVALNFLIFPYIARSANQASPAETAGYVRQALRLGAALATGPAIVLMFLSAPSIRLVFGATYGEAAGVLEILALGYIAFSLFTLTATILNGMGRPLVSLGIAAGTVALQAAIAAVLIPRLGIHGAAIASSVAYLAGFSISTAYLWRRFGSVLPWPSLARVAVATAIVFAAASTPVVDIPVVFAAPLLGLLYLGVLAVLGEAADLRPRGAAARPALSAD